MVSSVWWKDVSSTTLIENWHITHNGEWTSGHKKIHCSTISTKVASFHPWEDHELFWCPLWVCSTMLIQGLYFLFVNKTKVFYFTSLKRILLYTLACLASNKHENITRGRSRELATGSYYNIRSTLGHTGGCESNVIIITKKLGYQNHKSAKNTVF